MVDRALIERAVARAGGDPWAVIAEMSGYRHDRGGARFPIVFELAGTDRAAQVAALNALQAQGWNIPPVYRDAPLGTSAAFATATLGPAAYTALLRDGAPEVKAWSLQRPAVPQRARPGGSAALEDSPDATPRRSAGRPLYGVIDSGCPFARRDLQHANGTTRVVALWDQDSLPVLSHLPAGDPCRATRPRRFGYGGEVTAQRLEEWMARFAGQNGAIDEAACYRAAGYRMLDGRFQHGAAVLGMLAGRATVAGRHPANPDVPPRWDAPGTNGAGTADVVFVQVPRDAVQDTSSTSLPRNVLDGLRYIVDVARAGGYGRVVINLSDSTSRTAHDGASLIERAMAALVQDLAGQTPAIDVWIVLAAGNAFADLRHAVLEIADGASTAAVTLRLPPGSEAPAFATVAVPARARSLQLALAPPGAAPGPWIDIGGDAAGAACAWPRANEDAAYAWAATIQPRADEARLVALSWAPTASFDPTLPVAPVGNWEIHLRRAPGADGSIAPPVDVWISRGQTNPGALDRARQARFVDLDGAYDPCRVSRSCEDDPQPPRSPIRRHGTLNGIATLAPNPRIVVVGSRILRENRPSLYSSDGPGPARSGPDLWRPTDYSRTLSGVRAMGVLSGDVVRVEGTSFAAPQVARELMNDGAPDGAQRPDPRRTCRG